MLKADTAGPGSTLTRVRSIEVRGLVKTFGSTVALRGVDADLEAGRLTLIEGPNGSGKTTLLRIVGTLLRPTRGTVRYPPIGAASPEVLAQVSLPVGSRHATAQQALAPIA